MHDRVRRISFVILVLTGASLLGGCMLGPRPLSVEENVWFNMATGSDIHAVPPPSPYYPPYVRPYPAYAAPYHAPAYRAHPRRPAPPPPEPAPEFVPVEPAQR